ncbi:MAG: response regulator transcription factor [Actinobacteria bacterium]|nr:response regulator transcription factor [Actinomycetota bacterium]
MDSIKVMVVDDHTMVRESLATALSTSPDIEVVGTAGSGREALEKAKALHPEVILMDINMPKMNGIKACRLIKGALPEVNVVMLTVMDDEASVIEAVSAGASGYVLKSMPVSELVKAVKLAKNGKSMLHPDAALKLIRQFRKLLDDEAAKFSLTNRELEVLQLLAYGYTNKKIAEKMFISEQTVKSHVIHIFQKLGAADRTEAVAIALRKGLVE